MENSAEDNKKNEIENDKPTNWTNILIYVILMFLLISATVGLYNNDIHFFSHPGARTKYGGKVFHFRNTSAILLYISLLCITFHFMFSQHKSILEINEKFKINLRLISFIVSFILFIIAVCIASFDDFYGGLGWY
jgi:H+/gluconate symporter-like permease